MAIHPKIGRALAASGWVLAAVALVPAAAGFVTWRTHAAEAAHVIPAPAVDESPATGSATRVAVLAGGASGACRGCFSP